MLHVHRADRADALTGALGALLAKPPPDPFAPEVVAVPTRGIERWLTQQLSATLGASEGRRDGICANVEWPSPRGLVADTVARACGVDPDRDPWAPERLLWPLLDVIDANLDEPWLAVLAAHLRDDEGHLRGARRLKAARHLATLFDRYALHRPELVLGWTQDSTHWQAALWRRLREQVGTPSLAERLTEAAAKVEQDPAVADLPERLSIFGLTRLPAGHLNVLRALAHARDLHLFLLHPSPALWTRVAQLAPDAIVRRAEDPTAALPRQRLLASWGQDVRELQLVLGADFDDHVHGDNAKKPTTLLHGLQQSVRDDAPAPDRDARAALNAADRSLQIHACHGRARQVEVLRDALLHLLQDDDTLEPRDIVVMCPDIEAFAPLVHATFGAAPLDEEEDDDAPPGPPDLRVRLADRSLRQTNPVLGVVSDLLELADRRCTASEVLDLADRVPVRRRFRLDDDDISRLQEWVADSGIRWGLDAAHRKPYALDKLEDGTWRAGLDRVLLGTAMTEDDSRQFGGVLPLDDVEGQAIDLAGRMAELVDRVDLAMEALRGPHTAPGWADAITRCAGLLTDTSPRDAWQQAELLRLLADLAQESGAGADTVLALAEIRALLAARLEGSATRANFRTGHLTVCTMLPMRSVPHRVVCLLGLDDDVFPRQTARDGDDLLLQDPHVGERDPRREDRQLLLDALMAAEERLIITYTGRDERSNEPRPPAVPIGELLDTVEREVACDDARERFVVDHPLQPFDARNYTFGALAPDRVWSFDPATLEGTRALAGERRDPAAFLPGPLPPHDEPVIEVEVLADFAGRPMRVFLRRRLGISVFEADDEVADALPVELDGLERWGVGSRLLEQAITGVDLNEAIAAERRRGLLPPGKLADAVIDKVRPDVEQLALATTQVLDGRGELGSADVHVPLPGGCVLSGTVPGVSGDLLLSVSFSRVAPRHRLLTWVRWLALTASWPDQVFTAWTIGKGGRGALSMVLLTPPGDRDERAAFAAEQLALLADLYTRGMREPLPVAAKTSAAYALAALQGSDAVQAAEQEWLSGFDFPKEDSEPEHTLVLGRNAPLEALMAARPLDDESGPEWFAAQEPSRFGRYARRLWDAPLRYERWPK